MIIAYAGPTCITSSLVWPALVSILPAHVIDVGTILLVVAILTSTIIDTARPKNVTAHLDEAVRLIGEKADALGAGHNTVEVSAVKADLKRVRLRACKLRETTVCASISPWKEFKVFCGGHSLRVISCLREVNMLDTRIEIIKTAEEQRKIQGEEFTA